MSNSGGSRRCGWHQVVGASGREFIGCSGRRRLTLAPALFQSVVIVVVVAVVFRRVTRRRSDTG